MEEGEEEDVEEEEQEEEKTQEQEQLSNPKVCRASGDVFPLSNPQDFYDVLINLMFSQDDSQPAFLSRHSSQWRRPMIAPKWSCVPRDRPYGYCRSLSSSMENVTFASAPLSQRRGSLNELMIKEDMGGKRGFRDDSSLSNWRNQGTVVMSLMEKKNY